MRSLELSIESGPKAVCYLQNLTRGPIELYVRDKLENHMEGVKFSRLN